MTRFRRSLTVGWAGLCASLGIGGLGCAKTATVHGIPNFAEVAPGVWRSGQPPATAEAWNYIDSLGIRTVVKLNFPDEGSDDLGRAMGIAVHELGIEPAGDGNVFDQVSHTFVEPDDARVREAVALIQAGGGVLVHCSHGQDRTGIVIGAWRVRHQGWTKRAAWDEMIAHGFHPELLGLVDYWDEKVRYP